MGEKDVYTDFQRTSSFVHGQDILSKLMPFTFYVSIYNKLYLMMWYIFKTIGLYDLGEAMEEKIYELKMELLELGQKYC